MAVKKRKESSLFASFKRTAKLYLKSKIGMIGLAIIVFFLVLALFAPQLAPNNPVTDWNVAAPYSIPGWATYLPWYKNVSLNYFPIPAGSYATQAGLSGWTLAGSNYNLSTSNRAPSALIEDAVAENVTTFVYLNATARTNTTIAQSGGPDPELPYGQVIFSMTKSFQFDGVPPPAFQFGTEVFTLSMKNISAIYVVFVVQTPTQNYTLASVYGAGLSSQVLLIPQRDLNQWHYVNVSDGVLGDPSTQLAAFDNTVYDAGSIIFNGTGTYRVTMQIQGVCSNNPANFMGLSPCGDTSSLSMLISPVYVHFIGGAYGLLGTDSYGRDVWSQFVWGSQISLLIGVLSAVGAVGIGTLVGVSAGYMGGVADEILGRITDFVLVLPFLPLLIVLVFILTSNPALQGTIYYWVILIFIVISWPTVGRIIRSQVLSVKERSYVEASRAVGGGTWHILWKHILPNVMGLVYSQMALSVSGFILTEAALDFLAISIHPIDVMTWGIMLTQSLGDATSNSSASYVWWWFLPPGIAIAALSLAFVLVGFALDSIFNPRLRAR